MQRVSDELALAFGNQFYAKWQGIPLDALHANWAENLGEFSVGAIGYAMKKTSRAVMPPNLGEFIASCREYSPASSVLQLRRKFTPEELEANRKRIADIAEGLGMKMKANRE